MGTGTEEGPYPAWKVRKVSFLEEGRVSLASGDEPWPPDRAWLRGRFKPTAPVRAGPAPEALLLPKQLGAKVTKC